MRVYVEASIDEDAPGSTWQRPAQWSMRRKDLERSPQQQAVSYLGVITVYVRGRTCRTRAAPSNL